MSAFTTLYVTQTKAKEELIRQISEDFVTREELERLMEVILEKRLYNCTIVPDHCAENDDNRL